MDNIQEYDEFMLPINYLPASANPEALTVHGKVFFV